MRRWGVLVMVVGVVLCAAVSAVSPRATSWDDQMAASLDREEVLDSMADQQMPENMGIEEDLREAKLENPVDKFVWQSLDDPVKAPIPRQLNPDAERLESKKVFNSLFKARGVGETSVSASLMRGGGGAGVKTSDNGGRITANTRPPPPSPTFLTQLTAKQEFPPIELPKAPELPEGPKSNILGFLTGDDPNLVILKVATNKRDQIFNDMYAKAYKPGVNFVKNAMNDMEEMFKAANGNLGKQAMAAQVANSYILPAITGVWPALFYYNLEHQAVKEIAPSWWPTDPMPWAPESKKLPDVDRRGGIVGASEEFNIMIGATQNGNLKHHCTFDSMKDCID